MRLTITRILAGPVAEIPINRDTLADHLDQLGRDYLQLLVPHRRDGRSIRGESVVERNFVIGQAQFFAAFGGGVHFLCEAN